MSRWKSRWDNGDDTQILSYASLEAARNDSTGKADGTLAILDTGNLRMVDGDWVPEIAYRLGTPIVAARLTGAVLPSAETPAWTHTTSGAGTITTDGTRVRLYTPNSVDTAYVTRGHTEAAGGIHWLDGMMRLDSSADIVDSRQGFNIPDGVRRFIFGRVGGFWAPYATDGGTIVQTGGGYLTSAEDIDVTVEHRVTMIADQTRGYATLFLNGIPHAYARTSYFAASAAKAFTIGDVVANGRIDWKLRLLLAGVA